MFICKMWLFHFFPVNSTILICRETDISKYFRDSIGLRDNESRQYIVKAIMKNAGHIFDKYIYNRLRLQHIVIHFKSRVERKTIVNIFLKPLFRGNLDPFVNNANLAAIAHTSNGT